MECIDDMYGLVDELYSIQIADFSCFLHVFDRASFETFVKLIFNFLSGLIHGGFIQKHNLCL